MRLMDFMMGLAEMWLFGVETGGMGGSVRQGRHRRGLRSPALRQRAESRVTTCFVLVALTWHHVGGHCLLA